MNADGDHTPRNGADARERYRDHADSPTSEIERPKTRALRHSSLAKLAATAGDLSLLDGDTKAAADMYDRAARHECTARDAVGDALEGDQ